jgi:hypothetical protein
MARDEYRDGFAAPVTRLDNDAEHNAARQVVTLQRGSVGDPADRRFVTHNNFPYPVFKRRAYLPDIG